MHSTRRRNGGTAISTGLAAALLLSALPTSAHPRHDDGGWRSGRDVERRVSRGRHGNELREARRIDRRLDRRGRRIDRHLDVMAWVAALTGDYALAEALDRKGDRIARHYDRKGDRIVRRARRDARWHRGGSGRGWHSPRHERHDHDRRRRGHRHGRHDD